MRLTIIGCSGSFPGPESPASSYLLEAEGFRMLLDLGNGALGVMQRHAGLFDIDAICLSHLHADHCLDLCSYWVARQFAPDGPKPPVPVFGPAGTAERMAEAYGLDPDPGMTAAFDFVTLTPGSRRIGPFSVTTDHVNHPVETFGFRVEHGGRVLAYSADTGSSDALVTLARQADLFLCEASFLDRPDGPEGLHMSGRQAGEHAARAGVGHLILTHLVPWNDKQRSFDEASAAFGGKISLAASGQAFDLVPSGPLPLLAADSLAAMPRPDGRSDTELRPVKMTRRWLDHAEGSVLVEFGATRVLCAASVQEDVPRWRRGSGLGWVTAEYAMLPRATNTRGDRESVKGRLGGRTQEISRLVGRSLRACVDFKALGENTIVIDCDVLQADGGTRTAAITGGYVALADAVAWLQGRNRCHTEPLPGSVSAVSVGIVDGQPRLDLCYEEDSAAQTDMNVVCTGDGDFVEVQGTAEREPFGREMLGRLLDLAVAGCGELTRLQHDALAQPI